MADERSARTKVKRTRRRLYEAADDAEAAVSTAAAAAGEPARTSADEEEEAQEIVRRYTARSAGFGFFALPLIDLAGLLRIQARMLSQLARLYGVDDADEGDDDADDGEVPAADLPLSLVGGVGEWIERVPLVGRAAGLMMLPAAAGAVTYAMGSAMIQHFARGGRLRDFDAGEAAESFQRRYSDKLL